MTRHRTTARGIFLLLLALGLAAAGAVATSAFTAPTKVPRLVFPVVGSVTYTDDFGAPRAGGPHQGNDILAAKRAPAVAVETGKVKFWTTSANAGCMLYLYGASGTTYLYIHLNNDLTKGNDNRGKCVAGTSYARGLKNGARVAAGQQLGYVGDSGDADGGHAHLHFEVHPGGKAATDPYPYLQQAQHLLFIAPPGTPFTLALTGTVVSAGVDRLTLTISSLQAWPMGFRLTKLKQTVTLNVPITALVQTVAKKGLPIVSTLALARKGQAVVVWTQPAPATLKAERGDDGALSAALIQLAG
jgi:Peptidase family M23